MIDAIIKRLQARVERMERYTGADIGKLGLYYSLAFEKASLQQQCLAEFLMLSDLLHDA